MVLAFEGLQELLSKLGEDEGLTSSTGEKLESLQDSSTLSSVEAKVLSRDLWAASRNFFCLHCVIVSFMTRCFVKRYSVVQNLLINRHWN